MFTEHDSFMQTNLYQICRIADDNVDTHLLNSRLIRGDDEEPIASYGLAACTVVTESGTPFIISYMLYASGEFVNTIITSDEFTELQLTNKTKLQDTDVMSLQDHNDLKRYTDKVEQLFGIVPKVINLNGLTVKSNKGNTKLDLFNQLITGNYVKHRLDIRNLNATAKSCHLRLYTNDKDYHTYTIHTDTYSSVQLETLRDYLYLTGSLLA